ncbi:hypothetical protein F5X97DRAFT_305970 [Nemania serpens]|nr:hypothetical protein F5X97DRAFT_305970 [Nemania serpens]
MSTELRKQLQNPKDILSLLLLIGGDVVQRAIAQMFGVCIQPLSHGPRIYLTPVAFSFGWVGYAFTSLAAVVGDKQLMPGTPDGNSIVINCSTGYTRTNRSWLLGRILRDYEHLVEDGPGPEAAKLRTDKGKEMAGYGPRDVPSVPLSMRIDIFDLEENSEAPTIDFVWVVGWVTMAVQLAISVIPWILWGNWPIFFITGSGTVFALLTGSLRQWRMEKWPGRPLSKPSPKDPQQPAPRTVIAGDGMVDEEKGQACEEVKAGPQAFVKPGKKYKEKVVCLARGNGHRYVMILRGSKSVPDLEALATATSDSLPETKWIISGLAVLWTILLVCVSGIESDTWFLIGIGTIGMIQNIYAASAHRRPESIGLKMKPFKKRPTIIGAHIVPETKAWNPTATEKADDATVAAMTTADPLVYDWLEPWETPGVRGAIRELEKTIPRAGIALMPEYFPALWKIDSERYRDKREERFWRWMFKKPTLSDRGISHSS